MHTTLLGDLRAIIADKKAVIVVGTGVSLAVVKGGGDAAKFAGWQGLLESGLAECLKYGLLTQRMHDAYMEAMREDVGLDSFLQAATAVETALAKRPDVMTAWLNATVGKLPHPNTEIIDALAALGCPILTTNYDTLIANHLGRNSVPWTNADQMLPVARGEAPHILHLHGVYTEPRSVVLGWATYPRVAEDKASTLLKSSLGAMKTFVFVGCGADGLNDPDLGPFFQRYGELFASGRHFRLCLDAEAGATPHGITPITYSGHGDLVPLLKELAAPVVPPVPPGGIPDPAVAAPLRPAQLPPPLHRCLRGRDIELRQAIEWMVAREPFAVIGLAGMGKSALSLEALRSKEVEKAFGDRRWFVRLDAVKDANTLLGKIGQEMGLPPEPGRPRVVMDELAERGGAIVLDNAEDPLKADRANTEQVLSELAGLPGVALCVGVRGTDFPTRIAASLQMLPLQLDDARAVFLDLAGDRFTADPDLERLLGRLDGMPLPLYLLGRKAKQAPNIAWLLDELDGDGKRALKLAEGRQYDLAACIEVSVPKKGPLYDLLSLLGLLPDGIAADDLCALVGKDGRASAEESVAVGLAFWDTSLNRLRTLAPIREYFARSVAPRLKLKQGCYKYFIDALGQSYQDSLLHPRLAMQSSNLEAMLSLIRKGSADDGAIRAVIAYARLHRHTGVGRGIIMLERMLRDLPNRGCSALKGYGVWEMAVWNMEILNFDLCRRQLENAHRLFIEMKNIDGRAACGRALARLSFYGGRMDQAEAACRSALMLARHPVTRANCESLLGDICLYQSDLVQAEAHFGSARSCFEEVKELDGQGDCHATNAEIAWRLSQRNVIKSEVIRAFEIYNLTENISGNANCNILMSIHHFELGEWVLARKSLLSALYLLKRANNPLYDVDAHLLSARLSLAESSDTVAATEAVGQALAILAGKDIPRHYARCLCVQGEIALVRQDWTDAVAKFQAAFDLYPRHRGDDIAGDCWRGLGDAALGQGRTDDERDAWATAIDHYARFPNPHWIAQIKMRQAGIAPVGERETLLAECRRTWTDMNAPYWLDRLEALALPVPVA